MFCLSPLKLYYNIIHNYNGANVCPVSAIAVSFKKNVPFAHTSSLRLTNKTHSHQSLPH